MKLRGRGMPPAFVVAVLLIWHALLFYGLPIPWLLTLWLELSVWLYLSDPKGALMMGISIALCTVLLNGAIHFSGLEKGIYYRPHELMVTDQPEFGATFRPDTTFSMPALFGDIEATEKAGVREPHDITYDIDNLGFRNPVDYAQQKFVLLGDSFVAGASDTQSCLVSEWLRKDHALDTYNLGFPGDMDDYVQRIKAFRKLKGTDFKMALFIFEGNDFHAFSGKERSKPALLSGYYEFFKSSSLWRYTKWLYLRATKKKSGEQRIPLVVPIGREPMAFLSSDSAVAGNPTPLDDKVLHFSQALEQLKPNLVQIFFIPVKYRVYAQWVTRTPLPSMQWDYLSQVAARAGIPAYDLTASLVQDAERLLPDGQYVYWRDDTHWNCQGMKAAAVPIARQLRLR